MKSKYVWTFFFVIGLYLFTPQQSYAQSGATSAVNKSNQERIVQEILSEVRQLRVEVQRLKASAYQTQVVIERLRLQQEQVARLTREIGEVREIDDVAGDEAQVVGDRDGGDLAVGEGGPESGGGKPGPLPGVPARRGTVVGQHGKASGDLVDEGAQAVAAGAGW